MLQPIEVGTTPSGWPLHDAASTRRLEADAAAARAPHALMASAGLAVARLAMALQPHARRMLVVAGPGNNGSDGLVAARHLQQAGRQVHVALAAGAAPRPCDAAQALGQAQAAGVHITEGLGALRLEHTDLAIDALLGLGLRRAPEAELCTAIGALNRSGVPLLAVDLPSGLNSDTGRALRPEATVRARWTLSLLTLKPGLFTADGRDHAGQIWFDDLGVDAATPRASLHLLDDSTALWPARRHAQHKGSFGDVWVVGGAPGMRGAAWLAARAALAAGAGRVLVVPLRGGGTPTDTGEPAFNALQPELMLRDERDLQATPSRIEDATVVCGCGGGAAVQRVLAGLISSAGRLVLDADAINALARDRSLAEGLKRRAARGRPTVLTPHPLEAARWLGGDAASVQADRLTAARRLATDTGAAVVLKGSGSVVVDSGGAAWINASGNAALAGAGTGDVLAGWIGGLWAQGLEASAALRLGVHTHGLAADRWAAGRSIPGPLNASRLIERLDALRSRAEGEREGGGA